MIPLRVKLRGFLSYRDETELSFDGPTLWMLTGENGSGKSAVFDAVTFALFGAHRGGKQNAKHLIHHEKNDFLVEFDFRLDDDVYCARRTESRKGHTTRGIIHLSGPNAPHRKRNATEALVPETDSQDGFGHWVKTHIGLSFEAFEASVLLRQGKSDAILEMSGPQRHELLTQLVKLDRYIALGERAKQKEKEWDDRTKRLKADLDTRPAVALTRLDELQAIVTQQRQIVGAAQKELERVAALKVHAEHWLQHQAAKRETEMRLAQAQAILAQAAQIEADYGRHLDLQKYAPILKRLLEAQQHEAQAREKIDATNNELQSLQPQVAALELEQTATAQAFDETTQKQTSANRQLQEVQTQLGALNGQQQKIGQLRELRREQQTIAAKLAQLPVDLITQETEAKKLVEQLRGSKSDLPLLRQVLKFHQQQADADEEAKALETQLDTAEKKAATLDVELAQAKEAETQATAKLEQAQKDCALAESKLSEIAARLERLEEVQDESNCTYCGQKLTATHLDKERRLALQAQQGAQTNFERAKGEQAAALKVVKDAGRRKEKLESQLSGAQDALKDFKKDAQTKRKEARQARQEIQSISGDLSAEWQTKAKGGEISEEDVRRVENEAHKLPRQEKRLAELSAQVKTQVEFNGQLHAVKKQMTALEKEYSEERIRAIAGALHAAQTQEAALRAELDGYTKQLAEFKAKQQTQERQAKAFQSKMAAAHQTLAVAEAAVQQASADTQRERGTLTPAWQVEVDQLTTERLQQLEKEQQYLHTASERYTELTMVRQNTEHWQEQVTTLQQALDGIPLEAKHDQAYFQRLTAEAEASRREAETQEREAHQALGVLRQQQQQRAEIERQFLEAQTLAQRYKTLTNLLGRDGLQRHLLEQVERAIVDNANAILDKVSGCELWMELKNDPDQAAQKALDIVVHNRANGAPAIPVAFLSGSQRFRTAVCLALGIGQYALGESHRVEAVIIDEGFGSLDKTGRLEMIDELRNLKDTLRRIIVVSHQDEFAQAFPDRYLIQLENGSSVARLQVDTE